MDDDAIVIRLLGEPAAVGRPRFTRHGFAYTPTKTRNSLAALRLAAQQQMNGQVPLQGPLHLRFEAELAVPRSWSRRKTERALAGDLRPACRPDLDNLLRLADGMKGISWLDDAQVCEIVAVKRYGVQPQIVLTISPLRSDRKP